MQPLVQQSAARRADTSAHTYGRSKVLLLELPAGWRSDAADTEENHTGIAACPPIHGLSIHGQCICLSVCLSGSGSMLATVSRNVCLHGVCVSTVICICVAPFFKTGRLHALLHSGHSWQALTLQAAHLHQHVSSAWPRARSEPSLAFRTWDGHAVGGTDTRPAA